LNAVIRIAGRADREVLIRLLRAQFSDHTIQPAADRLETAVDRLLEERALGRLLVASCDGAIVGVAALVFTWSIEHGGRTAWLEELYVEPPYRGQGIGTALLHAACEAATAEGAAAVDLEVEAGHERAAGLYEREGFRRHARQRFVRPLRRSES
jgi:GNAT superfamily N-acetyltransferase